MLELKNISKTYAMGDLKVEALKGVSINFREHEFVSILGPSGCGKTTLLNIVGGLDKYTSGDLIIEGKSTKNFTDKDWDAYRNSKIGFVFQSYNLIPHLSVLENVELSLTLSGIKAKERKERAKKALSDVGLIEVINKRPNQLSGGQMQRVAIARALVNDPQIILADEPTGALDSETSVQIMEILKKISKKRLIIMVTHNKELAEKYSTRIINILDGLITNDSSPYSPRKEKEREISSKKDKTSMSFLTAFNLSFKNLFSKKGKTILTSFAGSIGIIGIALILAVSSGFTNYINNMQSDTLSGYPITISSVAIDYSALTSGGGRPEISEGEDGSLNIYNIQDILLDFGNFNYLSSGFVNYMQDYYNNDQESRNPELNAMQIQYATNMFVLTDFNNQIVRLETTESVSSLSGSTSSIMFEGFDDKDYVLSYYDEVVGHYPQNKNEVALVISQSNTISTTQLQSLGISFTENNNTYEPISLESLLGKEYKVILNNDRYTQSQDESNNTTFTERSDYQTLYNLETAETLTISGVLRLKEDASSSLFDEGIMYLPEFRREYTENCKNSDIAKKTVQDKKLYVPYKLDISELNMFIQDDSLFNFTDPYVMQYIIQNQYHTDITIDEVIDLALQAVGASSVPTGIYIYPTTFEAKQNVLDYIEEWNELEDGQGNNIVYTDATGFLTSTLGQLVNIISYVLIAFASISLVVSSIMIGIITYTSVIERTKEIGVLRSIGARKKDISRLFNAETATIGLISGILGIVVTYIFCPIINVIINNVAGVNVGQIAMLNPLHGLALIAISVVLTLISGLIPSRIAAKKDPVVALRTE